MLLNHIVADGISSLQKAEHGGFCFVKLTGSDKDTASCILARKNKKQIQPTHTSTAKTNRLQYFNCHIFGFSYTIHFHLIPLFYVLIACLSALQQGFVYTNQKNPKSDYLAF